MTSIAVLPLFIWSIFFITSPEVLMSNDEPEKIEQTQIKQQIEEKVCYPEFGRDLGVDEKVEVSFFVNDKGKVEVMEVDSETETMDSYVRELLDGSLLEITDRFTDRLYRIELDFKLF